MICHYLANVLILSELFLVLVAFYIFYANNLDNRNLMTATVLKKAKNKVYSEKKKGK